MRSMYLNIERVGTHAIWDIFDCSMWCCIPQSGMLELFDLILCLAEYIYSRGIHKRRCAYNRERNPLVLSECPKICLIVNLHDIVGYQCNNTVCCAS
jgi:hypothetical protein